MIRFACPKCKTVLENEPGVKFSCPGCGQRLQAPMPPENKTVMGKLLEPAATPAPASPPVAVPADALPAPAGGDVQVRILMGREHIFWNCPLCRNPVDTPLDLNQPSVRCPHCSQKIVVPLPEGAGTSRRSPPPLEPERVTTDRRESSPPYEDAGPRRRKRFADFDDYDDYAPSYRRGDYDVRDLMRASTSGLTCSVIGLGLLLIVFLLCVVDSNTLGGRRPALVFFILLVDLASFVLSLLGTIFSSRGLNPDNDSNRNLAVGGLVCGIVGLVISSVVGLVFMCIGLAILSGPTRW
jgi:DNA-directed RNA polymerase subunit RPC12/RpoP